MKPLNRIKTDWDANLAYAVGLLATDGCLYKDGRHIDFTSQDIQLIKTFKTCLNLKNKIGLKASGSSTNKCPRIQFGNILFYKWLLEVGITPHKSRTIADLKVPDEYFFDFLRGHFDGDGCCFSYWDKRWHSSFMFYITFASASEKHINWLRQKINNFVKINGYLGKAKKSNVYQLRYAKKESILLISKMYYKKGLPCLLRKFKKIQSILKTDKRSLEE